LVGRLVVLCGLFLVTAAASPDGLRAGDPLVLDVASFRGQVTAVAQDGPRVAWTQCGSVVVKNLVTRRAPIAMGDGKPALRQSCADELVFENQTFDLALAGTRALDVSISRGNSEYLSLSILGIGKPAHSIFESKPYHDGDGGQQYRGIAGNGSTLVYGVVNWTSVDTCPDYERTQSCPAVRNPSPIQRVDQSGNVRDVPGSEMGDLLAASGNLVATLRGERITVFNARTGARVGSATISCAPLLHCRGDQRPTALALGPTRVALVVGWARSAIRVYDWRTHRLVRNVQLPRAIRPSSISMSGALVAWGTCSTGYCPVYPAGHEAAGACPVGLCAIWILDLTTGRRRSVAQLRFDPLGVTIIGRRIVWGENQYRTAAGSLLPLRGYVRMLQLPSS
jgi:hypothetical protein